MNSWRLKAGMLAAVAVALVTAGCTSGQPTSRTDPATSQPPSREAGRSVPRVVVVIEENHSMQQIIGSPTAPFINRLADGSVLLTRYLAITHPSLPNYIAMISGDTQGITSNCGGCNVDAPNLVDQLEQAGISWKAYMQGLPAPCSDTRRAGSYAKNHNPFMYFQSIRSAPDRCRKVVPIQQLDTDLASGQLPRFVFISPDKDHDMHGTGRGYDDATLVHAADGWLQELYAKLTASSAWRQDTRLVVTWDEGHGRRTGQGTCCNGQAIGGNVATIVAGPRIKPARDDTTYSHYALLRSIETLFHLPYLGHASDPSTSAIPALTKRAMG